MKTHFQPKFFRFQKVHAVLYTYIKMKELEGLVLICIGNWNLAERLLKRGVHIPFYVVYEMNTTEGTLDLFL